MFLNGGDRRDSLAIFSRRSLRLCGSKFRLLFAALTWRLFARGFALWRLCYDQIVGLANQGFEFRGGQDVGVCQKYPFVAADVGGLGDAFDFEEFVEFFRSAFKANGARGCLERGRRWGRDRKSTRLNSS